MAKSPTTKAAEGSSAPATAETAWGTPPVTPAPAAETGNGGGSTEPAVTQSQEVPQTNPTEAAAPVENADPDAGQGRVVSPSPDVIPADAPTGSAEQADANTPAHHDATTEGSGPGGVATSVEQAERTGAPLADGKNGDEGGIPGYDPNRPDDYDGSDIEPAAPTLEMTFEPPSMMDLLANAAAVDANAAHKREVAAKKKPELFVPPKPLTEPIDFAPHPNEKVTDAIGSTHDAAGNPVVAARDTDPDGPGVPVYVGTAQPVANPGAGWRSNAS